MCQAEFLEMEFYSQKARGEFSEYTYLLGHIPIGWGGRNGLKFPYYIRTRRVRLSVEARPGDSPRRPFGLLTLNDVPKDRGHSGSIM